MKKIQILQYASLGLAALALLLQVLAVLRQFDGGTNYFKIGASLPTLAVIAALLSAAVGTVSALLTKVDPATASIFPKEGLMPSVILAVGFGIAIMLFALSLREPISGVALLAIVCSAIAAFYAIATGFPAFRAQASLITALGFSAPIACILFNGYYYFDTSVEMNSPIKTTVQVGLICAMLYFVSELRFLMGTPMSRLFLTLAGWTRSLGALSALAVPVAYLTGKCDRLDYVAGAILTFCVMLTANLRILALLQSANAPAITPENENADV